MFTVNMRIGTDIPLFVGEEGWRDESSGHVSVAPLLSIDQLYFPSGETVRKPIEHEPHREMARKKLDESMRDTVDPFVPPRTCEEKCD